MTQPNPQRCRTARWISKGMSRDASPVDRSTLLFIDVTPSLLGKTLYKSAKEPNIIMLNNGINITYPLLRSE